MKRKFKFKKILIFPRIHDLISIAHNFYASISSCYFISYKYLFIFNRKQWTVIVGIDYISLSLFFQQHILKSTEFIEFYCSCTMKSRAHTNRNIITSSTFYVRLNANISKYCILVKRMRVDQI